MPPYSGLSLEAGGDRRVGAVGRVVSGILVVFLVCAFATMCGAFPVMAQDQPQSAPPICGGEEIARDIVGQVSDGRTLTLADGREVRLAAIEVPPLAPTQGSVQPPYGAAAKAALEALAEGDRVTLRRADASVDRYGRIVAYAYTERDGDEIFVQGELIGAGSARIADRVGSRSCAAMLFARENAARTAKLGLWADPYYDLIHADAAAQVLAHKGQFALIEGRVVSVRESGSTIYVNFGRHWSEDFAVTVRKRNERSFAAAGLDLKALADRRVIVRGFVETRGTRGSPSIEVERPEQIEAMDGK